MRKKLYQNPQSVVGSCTSPKNSRTEFKEKWKYFFIQKTSKRRKKHFLSRNETLFTFKRSTFPLPQNAPHNQAFISPLLWQPLCEQLKISLNGTRDCPSLPANRKHQVPNVGGPPRQCNNTCQIPAPLHMHHQSAKNLTCFLKSSITMKTMALWSLLSYCNGYHCFCGSTLPLYAILLIGLYQGIPFQPIKRLNYEKIWLGMWWALPAFGGCIRGAPGIISIARRNEKNS